MKKLMIVLSVVALAAGVFADTFDDNADRRMTPIDLGLFSILKVPPFDRDVWGLKLNLIHSHELNVYGIDTGLVGCNTGAMAGLQANAFSWVEGSVYGVQVGGLGNYVTENVCGIQVGGLLLYDLGEFYGLQVGALNFCTTFYGLQIGALNWNYAGTAGVQLGVINVERHDVTGGSVGFMNYCNGNVEGAQIGVFNFANGGTRGVQIGLINAAQRLYGVQIGLVNINVLGRLPIMVIANANF